MLSPRLRRIRIGVLALVALSMAILVPVQLAFAADQQNYRDAQFVQITLGFPNQELGLKLVEGQPDGLTQPLADGVGRRTLANTTGPERYVYFDLHDTYIYGGYNRVIINVSYLDRGLTPIYLEYDSYDVDRPDSAADDVTRKRIILLTRTNSEVWRTEQVILDDARFEGRQPGNADFRLVVNDEVIIRNVSVLLLESRTPPTPIRVYLDSRPVTFDVVPYIDPVTNRTLVPMRAMFNALGIPDSDIAWEPEARQVTAQKGDTRIVLTIDASIAVVNGLPVELDQQAVIRKERSLAPLRFVSEQFGLHVDWNAEHRQIDLRTAPPPPPPPPPPQPGDPGWNDEHWDLSP